MILNGIAPSCGASAAYMCNMLHFCAVKSLPASIAKEINTQVKLKKTLQVMLQQNKDSVFTSVIRVIGVPKVLLILWLVYDIELKFSLSDSFKFCLKKN